MEIIFCFFFFFSRCSCKNENKLPQPQEDNFTDTEDKNPAKRLKIVHDVPIDKEGPKSGNSLSISTFKSETNSVIPLDSDKEPAPPFYFNLHRHSPKGQQLLRVDTVIQFLRKAGHRASRTHFDREAVRTNASLSDLTKILTEAANINSH